MGEFYNFRHFFPLEFKCFSKINCSDPTHDGNPVDGFLPIQDDRVHFVDVTNDGLKPGINPNQAANEMWTQIEQQVHQISSG